ncbi:MAG: hypothetical protein ACRDZ2_04400 [Ilumatobacteraceae bacterium]
MVGAPGRGCGRRRAQATLAVTPGTTINVLVGGKGADWVNQSPDCNTAR